MMCFFFQAEDGIRDIGVTGVQTCALPIYFCLSPFSFCLTSVEQAAEHPRGLLVDLHALREQVGGRFVAAAFDDGEDRARRSEERRVGKECRSRWSPYH